MKKIVKLLIALIVICPFIANAQTGSIEIWMRAFIPDRAHAGSASTFISPMPGSGGGSLVSLLTANTSFPNICFKTDNRGFSAAPDASSRLETKFTLNPTSGTSAAVIPAQHRTTAAVTTRVDCTTGAVIESKQAVIDRDAIGNPAVASGIFQVIGQVTGTNVLTVFGGNAPSIDYSFDLQWNPSAGKLIADITCGSFPAFELYARRPGGNWTPVVQHLPTGTPWALGGDSFGINSERLTATVTIPAGN